MLRVKYKYGTANRFAARTTISSVSARFGVHCSQPYSSSLISNRFPQQSQSQVLHKRGVRTLNTSKIIENDNVCEPNSNNKVFLPRTNPCSTYNDQSSYAKSFCTSSRDQIYQYTSEKPLSWGMDLEPTVATSIENVIDAVGICFPAGTRVALEKFLWASTDLPTWVTSGTEKQPTPLAGPERVALRNLFLPKLEELPTQLRSWFGERLAWLLHDPAYMSHCHSDGVSSNRFASAVDKVLQEENAYSLNEHRTMLLTELRVELNRAFPEAIAVSRQVSPDLLLSPGRSPGRQNRQTELNSNGSNYVHIQGGVGAGTVYVPTEEVENEVHGIKREAKIVNSAVGLLSVLSGGNSPWFRSLDKRLTTLITSLRKYQHTKERIIWSKKQLRRLVRTYELTKRMETGQSVNAEIAAKHGVALGPNNSKQVASKIDTLKHRISARTSEIHTRQKEISRRLKALRTDMRPSVSPKLLPLIANFLGDLKFGHVVHSDLNRSFEDCIQLQHKRDKDINFSSMIVDKTNVDETSLFAVCSHGPFVLYDHKLCDRLPSLLGADTNITKSLACSEELAVHHEYSPRHHSVLMEAATRVFMATIAPPEDSLRLTEATKSQERGLVVQFLSHMSVLCTTEQQKQFVALYRQLQSRKLKKNKIRHAIFSRAINLPSENVLRTIILDFAGGMTPASNFSCAEYNSLYLNDNVDVHWFMSQCLDLLGGHGVGIYPLLRKVVDSLSPDLIQKHLHGLHESDTAAQSQSVECDSSNVSIMDLIQNIDNNSITYDEWMTALELSYPQPIQTNEVHQTAKLIASSISDRRFIRLYRIIQNLQSQMGDGSTGGTRDYILKSMDDVLPLLGQMAYLLDWPLQRCMMHQDFLESLRNAREEYISERGVDLSGAKNMRTDPTIELALDEQNMTQGVDAPGDPAYTMTASSENSFHPLVGEADKIGKHDDYASLFNDSNNYLSEMTESTNESTTVQDQELSSNDDVNTQDQTFSLHGPWSNTNIPQDIVPDDTSTQVFSAGQLVRVPLRIRASALDIWSETPFDTRDRFGYSATHNEAHLSSYRKAQHLKGDSCPELGYLALITNPSASVRDNIQNQQRTQPDNGWGDYDSDDADAILSKQLSRPAANLQSSKRILWWDHEAEDRTIFVSHLPVTANDASLCTALGRCGEIEQVHIMSQRARRLQHTLRQRFRTLVRKQQVRMMDRLKKQSQAGSKDAMEHLQQLRSLRQRTSADDAAAIATVGDALNSVSNHNNVMDQNNSQSLEEESDDPESLSIIMSILQQMPGANQKSMFKTILETNDRIYRQHPLHAFVTFSTKEAAMKASEDSMRIFGVTIRDVACRTSRASTLRYVHVSNVPKDFTPEAVQTTLLNMLRHQVHTLSGRFDFSVATEHRTSIDMLDEANDFFRLIDIKHMQGNMTTNGEILLQFSSHKDAAAAVALLDGLEWEPNRPLVVGWATPDEWYASKPSMPNYF